MDMGSRLAKVRNLGLSGRAMVLTAVMLLLGAAVAPLAWWHSGAVGLLAAGSSAMVCWIGALGALVVNDHCRGPSRALHGLAGSIALRTGLPLLLALAMRFHGGALLKAGGVYYLLVFYLAALAVETPLSLPAGKETNLPGQGTRWHRPRQRPPTAAVLPEGNPAAPFHDLVLTYGRLGRTDRARAGQRYRCLSAGVEVPYPSAFRGARSAFPPHQVHGVGIDRGAGMVAVFVPLARWIASGGRPRGRLWNMFEVMVVFIRDQVARPAIGRHDSDRFLPFLWTMFFFILFLNLVGPGALGRLADRRLGVTAALAAVTFAAVLGAGIAKYGVVRFLARPGPAHGCPPGDGGPLWVMMFCPGTSGACGQARDPGRAAVCQHVRRAPGVGGRCRALSPMTARCWSGTA